MNLDKTDKKLLELLQEDAKQTNKQLALQLNLSTTAVYERIKRLERAEIITKYIGIINHKAVEKSFVVLCHIKLVQHTKEYLTKFESEILELDEVLECLHVSGDYDYIIKIYVKDMDAYREFMVTKLTTIRHIGSTHSTFVISEIKKTFQIKLT